MMGKIWYLGLALAISGSFSSCQPTTTEEALSSEKAGKEIPCDSFAETVTQADAWLQGTWRMTSKLAGRAGIQAPENVTMTFSRGTVEVKVGNNTPFSMPYQVYIEQGSKMMRLDTFPQSSIYREEFRYFWGYLLICPSQLRVGLAPVDGTDYIYSK
jgi:hypothetical protein